MAAPAGNQFWRFRTKHGRDRIIQDADKLWEDACEYFQWCIDNPLIEVDFRGKDCERVEIPHMRVFQKSGLCLATGVVKWETFEQLKEVSKDFLDVVTRIEDTIRNQKFEGASADMLNARIIAQDLGLNTQQIIVTGQRKTVDELFPEEDSLNGPTD